MQTKMKTDSYRKELLKLQENLGAMLPEASLNVFDKDAKNLEKIHREILRVRAGDKAPEFSLKNALGKEISLSSKLNEGPVVLTFYRGNWCPYCNLQLGLYQQNLSKFNAYGAQLIAVSPQNPDASMSMKERQNLDFEVVSDPKNHVARKYTTVFANAPGPLAEMESLGIDFFDHYEEKNAELPVPAVFVIDAGGIIRFAKAEGGDYRNRVAPEEILTVFDSLNFK